MECKNTEGDSFRALVFVDRSVTIDTSGLKDERRWEDHLIISGDLILRIPKDGACKPPESSKQEESANGS